MANELCGAVCPACGYCCANLIAPYIDLRATVAYKVACQRCGAIYVQKV